MFLLPCALVLGVAFLRGLKVTLPLIVLLLAAYVTGFFEYPKPAPLVGAAAVGLLLARGTAPLVGALALLFYWLAHCIAAGLAMDHTWTGIDLAELVVDANAIVSAGLLAAIGAASFLRRPPINWFHVTYAPLAASASIPSAVLFSGVDLLSPTATWLTAAFVLLVAAGSHVLALKLRSEPHATDRSSPRTKVYRFPYPIELRRQLARLRAARAPVRLPAPSDATERHDGQPASPERKASSSEQPATDPSVRLKRMRAALKEARARYVTLVENVPHAVLFADLHGIVVSANRATKRVLRYSAPSLIGTNIKRLIPPGSAGHSHPLDLELLIKAPDETVSIRSEADVLRRDGKSVRTAILVDEVAGSRNCKYAIQILSTNEVERATKILKKARATARAHVQARIETLAAMSHELRTPLHGLIATLDMLRDEPLTTNGSRQLAVAKTSAKSLLKLVNDVLDIARMEGSKFPLNSAPFNLPDLLHETIDEFKARASAKGLELRCEIAVENLPKSYIGDRQRVKQILANLVSNAINFTSYGGVSVRLERDGSTTVLDVSDTGPGVPPAVAKSIFEPFVRAKTEASAGSGTGLGLAISRQLCKAMGGDLVLLKTGSSGSTFRATLVLEESDEEAPHERSSKLFMNPVGTILVVEDHEINQYVVKAMLDSLGCTTKMVSNGTEAIETLRQERFDLILMDCRMPGLDGYETTRRVRKTLRIETPIVAMTANASQEERAACIDAGMDDFLPKPFGRSELSAVLCKWLDPQRKLPRGPAQDIVLDEGVFDELWESLHWQEGSMRTICESFMETIDNCARSILANEEGDLARRLHTLLGTSAMIGAREVNGTVVRMQECFKTGRSEDLPGLVTKLRAASKTFRSAFYERLHEKLGYARPPGAR